MLTKFWDKITENLAQEWQIALMAPSFVFWSAGLALYAIRHGWQPILNMIAGWNIAQSVAAILAGLGILTISTALINQFTVPILRLLEGYWRAPFSSLANSRIAATNQQIKEKEERWNWLAQRKAANELTALQLREYALLDADLFNYPLNENWRMPTRLGNLMRAAEEYANVHYGLEITITWSRLWLLLPASTQQEISRSRQNLDRAIHIFTWAILFTGWAIWNPWAVVISIFLSVVFYQSILQNAGAYAELLKAAYDLNRFNLYDALHWPKPDSPQAEIRAGQALTNFLHRAEANKKIKYDFHTADDKSTPHS